MRMQKQKGDLKPTGLSIQIDGLINIRSIQSSSIGDLNISQNEAIQKILINTSQAAFRINEKLIKSQIQQQSRRDDISFDDSMLQTHKNISGKQLIQPVGKQTQLIEVKRPKEESAQFIAKKFETSIQNSYTSQQALFKLRNSINQKQKETQKMIDRNKLLSSDLLNDATHISESLQTQAETKQKHPQVQCWHIQGRYLIKSDQQNNALKKQDISQVQNHFEYEKQEVKCEQLNDLISQKNVVDNKTNLSQQQVEIQDQQERKPTKQQMQEIFEKQQQKIQKQKFQSIFVKQMLKAKKFLSRILTDPKIQRSIKALPAKFKKIPKIKELLLLEINVDLINEIERCQTYDCQFLNFLIPYLYLLASTLNFYEYESSKNLSIYYVFTQLINKINKIKNKNNAQLTEQELLNHLVKLANYRKYTSQELNSMIGDFLKKHSQRMRGFMPAYYDIFYFHAFQKYSFVDSLQDIPDIRSKRQKLSARLQKLWGDLRKKYHNQYL